VNTSEAATSTPGTKTASVVEPPRLLLLLLLLRVADDDRSLCITVASRRQQTGAQSSAVRRLNHPKLPSAWIPVMSTTVAHAARRVARRGPSIDEGGSRNATGAPTSTSQ